MTIAIIPARGGSKGLPGKNILPFCGKPLIGWAIEAALGASSVTEVFVSTDDPEISRISSEFGASVVVRPDCISGDVASSELALLHVLREIKEAGRPCPPVFAFIQCTSPLIISEDIDHAMQRMLLTGADTVFSAAEFHRFIWKQSESGSMFGVNHNQAFRLMRQQAEPQFLETGSFYLIKTEGFLEHKHRFFGKTCCYMTCVNRAIEIDSKFDFDLASAVKERLLNESRESLGSDPVSGKQQRT